MIVLLKGRLEDVGETTIVLDVNGIYYEVNITEAVRRNLPPLGQEMKIHTYLQVREDAMILYGFQSREERSLFQQIIGVASIGPKTGLGILSGISPLEFMRAVEQRQLGVLTGLPGIGKKTGERILLELRGKFKDVPRVFEDGEDLPPVMGGILEDARAALLALGYSANEAERMVQSVQPEIAETYDLQEILKTVLANNAKRGERAWRRNE